MVVITPGVDFIARSVASVGLFFGIVVNVHSVVASRLGYHAPTWAIVAGAIFSIPTLATLNIMGRKLYNMYQASRMGAQIVPEAQGKWPGNLDILLEMMKNFKTGYPGDGLVELLEKRGPVVNMRVMWSDTIFTASPEHIKTMLATDFENYVKGKRFIFNMESVLGTGVFNSDGEMWKFHRSITRPMFTRERISHFELFDRRSSQVVDKLRERLRQGYAVDFQDLMSRFTLDAATEFLFGSSVDSLTAGLPYPENATNVPTIQRTAKGDAANEFATAFLEAQNVISVRERFGWVWPLAEIAKDKSYQPMQVVNAYIDPIVKDALARKRSIPVEERGLKNGEHDTLVDNLVSVTDDPVVLKDEILNIMIAGKDTTASTLTFIFYFLSIYPEVMNRLRTEILDKVGPSRRPDYDDIREMRYLRAVINETLRLYPIVPFNIRESVKASTWKSSDPTQKPYFIPAGVKTAYSVFMMHRRKDLWGPDAEEFDPDRFLDERLKKYLSKNPFIFLPFNAGPRICLGQQFAYNEMSFIIVRLLQNFSSVELDPDSAPADAHPPKEWAQASGRKSIEKLFPKMHLTMYTNGGLWVKMTESDNINK
ncbi:Cytochrome P450 monooxygenase 75 [Psilocybe cubensis]|uniref:Cytochrome P450 monooxygenase 75 n=2 Tax=Psilocybe cubensis TaxID=181762 RepID=A0ACB8GNB4_PSICU|nr:Cytochrome P450 monooxygenase 75 [Psilocybe cubensis]KAH9476510.1 Cytochrome P450 monooxygenase 75 [Psilocybe cubensis]